MAGATWFPLMLLMCACAWADIVMHNPRGSNNRLNENTANRANNNRLFNSQNNNKGSYNVGDEDDDATNDEDDQYAMRYFQSDASGGKTILEVEWTNQHGCGDINGEGGDAQKRYCDLVFQYMCQDDVDEVDDFDRDTIRNGDDTDSQDFSKPRSDDEDDDDKRNNVKIDRGLHETWDWYKRCYLREANGGLFLADQDLDDNRLDFSAAIHTRQNPDGDRSGYECDEERDYFPYWQANPWTDVAVLTSDPSRCETLVETSLNSETKGRCFEEKFKSSRRSRGKEEVFSRCIDEDCCSDRGGIWRQVSNYIEKADLPEDECEGAVEGTDLSYAWRIPYDVQYEDDGSEEEDSVSEPKAECLVIPGKLDCQTADFSRMNHHGNGKGGQMTRYKWELPYFPSGEAKRCIFRARYNISTFDYDPYTTDASSNDDKNVIENNPEVDVHEVNGRKLELQLALNTAQTGRTFQDRSHVFKLLPREDGMEGRTIYNLNVRGRRGNIVQTYPSVEYDFTPNDLTLTPEDLLHIQWTGSNSNPDDDGQGKARSDRSNLVPVNSEDVERNYPTLLENLDQRWKDTQVVWTWWGGNTEKDLKFADLYVELASSGYYKCETRHDGCKRSSKSTLQRRQGLDDELDNAPASFKGVVLRFPDTGKYHFMCTRNNNFSNRSQKGGFTVVDSTAKVAKKSSEYGGKVAAVKKLLNVL